MIFSESLHKLVRPIQQQLVSLLPSSVSGRENSDEIVHSLLDAVARITRLGTENHELRQQVALLKAKLEARQNESKTVAETLAEAAIAERFGVPTHALSDLEYEDKLEFVTRVIALSSLGVRPEVDCAQVRFDAACEALMENPAHFCRKLEKFDSLRRIDNDKWSWLELYNDLHNKNLGQAYFLNGDPEVRMTMEIS